MIGEAWTPDRVEVLIALWLDGNSAADCAKLLNARFAGLRRLTRNSVIGKVNRLGLSRSAECGRETKRLTPKVHRVVAKPRPPRPEPKPKPKPVLVRSSYNEPASLNLSVLQLRTGTCRWPTAGEGADTVFCGGEADGPYCIFHRHGPNSKVGAYRAGTALSAPRPTRAVAGRGA